MDTQNVLATLRFIASMDPNDSRIPGYLESVRKVLNAADIKQDTGDMPRIISRDEYTAYVELDLEISRYNRAIMHTVAAIDDHGGIELTRTNTGYIAGDDNGHGYSDHIPTVRFHLSAEQMQRLVRAYTRLGDEAAETKLLGDDDIPF